MNSTARSGLALNLAFASAVTAAVPIAAIAAAAAPEMAVIAMGGTILLAFACAFVAAVTLDAPSSTVRKLAVLLPSLITVGLAVMILTSNFRQNMVAIEAILLGLGYAWILDNSMQITAWNLGRRSEKPNWILSLFKAQSQDPGFPSRNPFPACLLVGGVACSAITIVSPVIAAVSLGILMACAVWTSVFAGGSSLATGGLSESNISLRSVYSFSSALALLAAGAVGLIGMGFGHGSKPLFDAKLESISAAGTGTSLAAASAPAPETKFPNIWPWVALIFALIVGYRIVALSPVWFPWVTRLLKFLARPFGWIGTAWTARRGRAASRKEAHRIADLAAEIQSPLTRPPASFQDLLEGMEYLFACAGVRTRLSGGLRASFMAARRAFPNEPLDKIFRYLERAAYFVPEPLSEEITACFAELARHVQSTVSKEVLAGRESAYRLEKAERLLSEDISAEAGARSANLP